MTVTDSPSPRPAVLPADVDLRWIPAYEERYAASSDGRIWSYAFKEPREIGTTANTNYVYASVSSGRRAKRKMARVHRLVYAAFVGDPGDLDIDHVDGNRANNAVSNLEAVTPAENIRRRDARGATARGEGHGTAVLTEAQVVEIRERYAAGGQTHGGLAEEYGVSTYAVSALVRGESWVHVDGPRTYGDAETVSWRLTDEDKTALRAAYEGGEAMTSIMKRYGISKSTAYAHVRAIPKKPGRRRKFTPEQVEEILAAVEAGESQSSVARRFGCSQPTISNTVRKHRAG